MLQRLLHIYTCAHIHTYGSSFLRIYMYAAFSRRFNNISLPAKRYIFLNCFTEMEFSERASTVSIIGLDHHCQICHFSFGTIGLIDEVGGKASYLLRANQRAQNNHKYGTDTCADKHVFADDDGPVGN